jgi:hypothetical protein
MTTDSSIPPLRGHLPPADLHPSLRRLLEAELAAGNVIREIGRNFPDPGSLLVQLREPFKHRPDSLPDDVIHLALNDPHWWMDEYRAGHPPHLLVG